MSDRRKEAEEKMEKAIFISVDCWLCVFDLLPASQLGLGIALISHRFDFYVSEHFKTRKWTLGIIRIWSKIGEDGTKEMKIVNGYGKPMQIPLNPLPKKIVGFKDISIEYIDNNMITFLHRFRQLFAKCPINLNINTYNDRIAEFVLHKIWPMLNKNIYGLGLSSKCFQLLRKFIPSLLNECPSLRFVSFYYENFITEFPPAESANASNGQVVANWLFTSRPDNMPKMLKIYLDTDDGKWLSNIAAFKAAFSNASSPVNFIIAISFPSSFADSVVPFDLTNELTQEQLALKRTSISRIFVFVRCPIVRDESKWAKWEEEVICWHIRAQWNTIGIYMNDEREIGDGLLDETPGPSDQQQK